MKLTDKPTDWIILAANNNSEWDSVDFALLNITSEIWKRWVMDFIKLAEKYPVGTGFYNISLWAGPDGWYILPEDEELDIEQTGWSYVEVTEEEIEGFDQPENKIRGDQIKLFADGTAKFSAYGDYTGEEFWTEDFPLKEIIEKYESTNKAKSTEI